MYYLLTMSSLCGNRNWLLPANADYKSSMTVNEDNLLFIIDLYRNRNCHTHKYPPDGDNIAIQVYNL